MLLPPAILRDLAEMAAKNKYDGAQGPRAYDYVIVGGGTAGVVLASRLTEDPNINVIVIEAGGDRSADPLVLTPGLVGAVYGKDEYDWNFSSVPQVSEDQTWLLRYMALLS